MILKKIKFIHKTYTPASTASIKVIRPKMLKFLNEIKNETFKKERGEFGDMRAVARKLNIKLEIRTKINYSNKVFMAGTVSFVKRKIILAKRGRKKNFSKQYIRGAFTHELSHIIQNDNNLIRGDKLSEVIIEEQEAEAMAYELCLILFPKYKFTKSIFRTYFCEDDIIFLEKYYQSCNFKNDLFEWLKEPKKK